MTRLCDIEHRWFFRHTGDPECVWPEGIVTWTRIGPIRITTCKGRRTVTIFNDRWWLRNKYADFCFWIGKRLGLDGYED